MVSDDLSFQLCLGDFFYVQHVCCCFLRGVLLDNFHINIPLPSIKEQGKGVPWPSPFTNRLSLALISWILAAIVGEPLVDGDGVGRIRKMGGSRGGNEMRGREVDLISVSPLIHEGLLVFRTRSNPKKKSQGKIV